MTEEATLQSSEEETVETTEVETETETEIETETEKAVSSESETSEAVTAQIHTHSFISATCTSPKTCSCGVTEGDANGHNWKDATCTSPKICAVCGERSGTAIKHSYSSGKCISCDAQDPNYVSEELVWIPTNGGTKYHIKASCSKMIDPIQVTKSVAINQGFGPCGRCY